MYYTVGNNVTHFFCLTLLSAIFSCREKSLKQYLFFLCNFYLAKVCREKLQIRNSILI
jgi:hypothetical protein